MIKIILPILIFLICACAHTRIVDGSKYCPANKDGNHHWTVGEKCNEPGCGGWCKCKYFQEYSTGKWFASKQYAIDYIKRKRK